VVGPIREINAWLQGYAKAERLTWVDYTPVLGDAKGAMKPGLAYDGVHPTEAGYDAMASVIEPILKARHA
jgi:lysophospholipase L1-like esterase